MKKLPMTVQNCLRDYQALLNESLPGMVQGIYVHGSIALDAYIPGKSDVDFLTILNRECTNKDLERLSNLHRKIEKKYDAPLLDGGYIRWEGVYDNHSFKLSPYFNDGELQLSHFYNPITAWILQTKGITITGPDIQSAPLAITSQQLIAYVARNMNEYWAVRTKEVEDARNHFLGLRDDEIDAEIEWCVLGLLRQYYTLREQKIISKAGAGHYGLKHVDAKWHSLITYALTVRNKSSAFRSIPKHERVALLIGFNKDLIQSSLGETHYTKVGKEFDYNYEG